MDMQIPREMTVQLSEAQRFCIGLEKLAEETGLSSYGYNKLFGIFSLEFNDGSSVGMARAWIEAGILDENFNEK
jgi:hypothetical protein